MGGLFDEAGPAGGFRAGEGRRFGIGFVWCGEGEAAERALGLQGLEIGFVLFERHGVDFAVHQGRFEDTAAADIPVGVEERVEEGMLELAVWRDTGGKGGAHGFERLELRFGDDEVGGGEPVPAGVLRGAGFAGLGAGARGKLGVGLVGGELGFGWHGRQDIRMWRQRRWRGAARKWLALWGTGDLREL